MTGWARVVEAQPGNDAAIRFLAKAQGKFTGEFNEMCAIFQENFV